jgi:hypothetical protein
MSAGGKARHRTPHPAGRQEQPMDTTWTPERIRDLGPTTDLPTLASILRCSTWKAYQMARTDQWQAAGIRIIRVGSCYKVVVLSILEVLGYEQAGGYPARHRASGAAPAQPNPSPAAESR